MADDEKDRLGDHLHRKEKGEEERFFAERERKLLERLRQPRAESPQAHADTSHGMRCPRCGIALVAVPHEGTAAAECPSRHGMWLDQADLERLAARERDSWLGRFFHRPRR